MLADASPEPQYGFFGTLMPTEEVNRSYTFKILESQQPVYLEYQATDNNAPATVETLKWKVQQ